MKELKERFNSREDLYRPVRKEMFDKFTSRLIDLVHNTDYDLVSTRVKDYANSIDMFQFHYMGYLCGYVKTRHRTFCEFDGLKECELFSKSDFTLFLAEIERFLLKNELYEALSKFVKTNKILEKRIRISGAKPQ